MKISFITYIFAFVSLIAQSQCFWKLNKKSYYVGDKVVATLVIPESTLKKDPVISTTDAFRFRFLEHNTIQNEEHQTTFYRYQVVPLKGGFQHFPEVIFPNHKKLNCKNHKIHIKTPVKNPNLKLDVSLSQQSCYKTQPIDLKFTWRSAIPLGNLKGLNIDIPFFRRKDFKVFVPNTAVNLPPDKIGLPVAGNRMIADIKDTLIDKVKYKMMSFTVTIIPLQQGKISIPASTLLCSYIDEKSSFDTYPAYFDNNLFDGEEHTSYKRLYTQSTAVSLLVKELPTSNRPYNFSGLFNAFKAKVQLNKTNIKTGEALRWKLEITDYEHPETFHLPALTTILQNHDELQFTNAEPELTIQDPLIIIEKRIRIKQTGMEEWPSIQIPYFNVEKGAYQYVHTDPIIISVEQGEYDTEASENDSSGTVKKTQITVNPNGISQLYTKADALNNHREQNGYWFWIILLLVPAVFGLYLYLYKKHTDTRYIQFRRIKQAVKRFNKQNINSSITLEAAIKAFIIEAFDVDANTILPSDMKALMKKHCPGADIHPIAIFYAQHYKAAYDKEVHSDSLDSVPLQEIQTCINQLPNFCLKQ